MASLITSPHQVYWQVLSALTLTNLKQSPGNQWATVGHHSLNCFPNLDPKQTYPKLLFFSLETALSSFTNKQINLSILIFVFSLSTDSCFRISRTNQQQADTTGQKLVSCNVLKQTHLSLKVLDYRLDRLGVIRLRRTERVLFELTLDCQGTARSKRGLASNSIR